MSLEGYDVKIFDVPAVVAPAPLVYYMRRRPFNHVIVESCLAGEDPSATADFIRLTPEIKHPDDITPELLAALRAEADAYCAAHPYGF